MPAITFVMACCQQQHRQPMSECTTEGVHLDQVTDLRAALTPALAPPVLANSFAHSCVALLHCWGSKGPSDSGPSGSVFFRLRETVHAASYWPLCLSHTLPRCCVPLTLVHPVILMLAPPTPPNNSLITHLCAMRREVGGSIYHRWFTLDALRALQ